MKQGGKMTLGRFAAVAEKMVLKDRIYRANQDIARILRELRVFKRTRGYCGGVPTCMRITGDTDRCDECRALLAHKGGTRRLTEYGRLRARDRAEAKKGKARPHRRAA